MAFTPGIDTAISIESTTITQVVSIKTFSATAGTVDIKTLDATAVRRLGTIPDWGSMTLVVEYDPEAASHDLILDAYAAQTAQTIVVTLADGSNTFGFEAICSGIDPTDLTTDNSFQLTTTWSIDGAVTYPTVA